jgi:hypothetical protein
MNPRRTLWIAAVVAMLGSATAARATDTFVAPLGRAPARSRDSWPAGAAADLRWQDRVQPAMWRDRTDFVRNGAQSDRWPNRAVIDPRWQSRAQSALWRDRQ